MTISKEKAERAKRVRIIRKMTGLSRAEFGKKTGITSTTLQHWENPERGFPEDVAEKLIKAAQICRVECPYEWLMYGIGLGPRHQNRFEILEDYAPPEIKKIWSKDAQTTFIQQELAAFLNHHSESIELLVLDDAMSPGYLQGDIVAGIRKYGNDISKLMNKDCIVTVEGGETYLRTIVEGNIPNHYNLLPANVKTTARNPLLRDVKLISAAFVIWLRRIDID
jgi:transcriptional regulator with XRE-family HTH domain